MDEKKEIETMIIAIMRANNLAELRIDEKLMDNPGNYKLESDHDFGKQVTTVKLIKLASH